MLCLGMSPGYGQSRGTLPMIALLQRYPAAGLRVAKLAGVTSKRELAGAFLQQIGHFSYRQQARSRAMLLR